jgi:hypothetical protein
MEWIPRKQGAGDGAQVLSYIRGFRVYKYQGYNVFILNQSIFLFKFANRIFHSAGIPGRFGMPWTENRKILTKQGVLSISCNPIDNLSCSGAGNFRRRYL